MATILTTTYDSVANSNALTITLASLATSASFLAGRNSTIVDNTSAQYLDFLVSGQITVGTTPTVDKQIALFVYAPLKIASSVFSYPIATTTALTESDAAATFEAYQLAQLKPAAVANVIATSDRAYSFAPFSIAALFGGVCPPKFGIFVAHNTGVNLNATAGNHWLHWTGIKRTST
ncbi:MAG TPA: hypothetical protein PLN42_09895 [Anaerolineae bacterium]|nr:hypothetical protein [Anaerolineae bacterium]